MARRRVYPSDLTDAQWEIIEPMLPLIREPGRIPKHPFRDIVVTDLVSRSVRVFVAAIPGGLPALADGVRLFRQWKRRGVTERILDELREQIRVAEGRDPQPSAGVIDSQSVKGANTVGRGSRVYDAGKKVNGRQRFIVTDTLGLLVGVTVAGRVVAGP